LKTREIQREKKKGMRKRGEEKDFGGENEFLGK